MAHPEPRPHRQHSPRQPQSLHVQLKQVPGLLHHRSKTRLIEHTGHNSPPFLSRSALFHRHHFSVATRRANSATAAATCFVRHGLVPSRTCTVTSGALSATSSVTVNPAPIASFAMAPPGAGGAATAGTSFRITLIAQVANRPLQQPRFSRQLRQRESLRFGAFDVGLAFHRCSSHHAPTIPEKVNSVKYCHPDPSINRLCTGIWQSVRFDGVFSEAGFSIDSAV